MNSVYKIRYQDSMTTHLLHESFNTTEEAELFIALNLVRGAFGSKPFAGKYFFSGQ